MRRKTKPQVRVRIRVRQGLGGVVDTKVRYVGVKSTKVPRGQMGTKPAKVTVPQPLVADPSG